MAESEAWVMIPKLDEKKTGCVLDIHPLVLCKDCKSSFEENGMYFCKSILSDRYALVDKNWFCADGERR